MAGISDKALKMQYSENKYKFNEGRSWQVKNLVMVRAWNYTRHPSGVMILS